MPATMKWTEAMSVGVEDLDEDHRQLIHLINALNYGDADFAHIFNQLLDYTCGHFEREEAFLEGIGYPGISGHRAQHDAFADQVSVMLKRHKDGIVEDEDAQVKDFLWTWLKGHILIEDLRYTAWNRARQP